MRVGDLKTISEIGSALWQAPAEARPRVVETLSAVALLEVQEERVVERAARALLDRALRESSASARGLPVADLYGLYPQERFLLMALHAGRWSYARLSRILELEPEKVEELAWNIRTRLSSLPAIGAEMATPNCPEYDSRRPWTQRFMDEEISSGRERIFLQNHLMVCDSCRRCLNRARDIYFAVDARIPRMSENAAEDRAFLRDLSRVTRDSRILRDPIRRSVPDSLRLFLGRVDVQWAVLAGLLLVIAALLR